MNAPKWIMIEIISFYINVVFIIVNIFIFKFLPYFKDIVVDSSDIIKAKTLACILLEKENLAKNGHFIVDEKDPDQIREV